MNETHRAGSGGASPQGDGRFRLLFEHSPDAIFVETLDGIVLDVNDAACRLHGRSREELVGINVLELVPPAVRNRVHHDARLLALGDDQQIHSESLHADGRAIPVEIRVKGIEYDGQPALLLNVRDISARVRVEAQVRESEAKYRQLVEQLPAVTYKAEFDDGRWFYVSPQIEAMLGFTRAEWMAEKCPWLEQIHPEDRPHVLAAEALCRETREPFAQEYRIHTRDGHVMWFSDRSVVVCDAGGQPRYLHGVMFDITGRKLTEKTYYEHSGYPGGLKSISLRDQMEKHPDRVIRSAVWGMLPHNKMGRHVLKRLKVYSGAEHPHGAQVGK